MQPITIYTTRVCLYCVKAKSILKRNDLPFAEVDVSADDARMALVQKTGRKTVPQIYVGNVLIGGCDDLEAAEASGKLAELVSEPGLVS